MTIALLVVCEAAGDFTIASDLADRVISECVEWIRDGDINDYRTWRGLDDLRPFLTWSEANALAREADIKVHGPFAEGGRQPDAATALRVLLLLETREEPPGGVLLIRDDDRDTRRREGLEQARAASKLECPIVIGVAHVERECWVLTGFEPRNSHEQSRLDDVATELHFDPRTSAELLDAKRDHQHRSAKRVLRILTDDNPEREAECWRSTSLDILRTRGEQTGLTSYLAEVEHHLVPLFDPTPRD